MAEVPLRGAALGVPHGFLTAAQSDAARFDLIAPAVAPVFLKQVHSARVIEATAPFAEGERPEADALVSATPGTMLGIVTADCAPVLFADKNAGVIGAAHAGWRGAHGGVLEATLRHMEGLGASLSNVTAVIGPTIAQASYEVGFDFREKFEERHAQFFRLGERPGKWLFDLPAYVRWRLESAGVGTIEDLGIDTYSDEARLYSFRRATHRAEATGGRQFSLVYLPA